MSAFPPHLEAFRRLERAFVRRLLRLPPGLQVKLSGKPAVVIDGLTLDPQIQLLLAARALRGGGSIHTGGPVRSRKSVHKEALWYASGGPPISRATDRTVPGAEGPLPARLYEPLGDGPRPLLVFFHGGGFVTGDLETHDDACRTLCHHTGALILAVDYRLAPEHHFPSGVEDAVSAFRWAHAHAAELGADEARVGVAGDSAGGNLAAVVSALTLADGGTTPFLQVLIYPTADQRREFPSATLFAEGFFLTRADMDWFDDHYLGEAKERREDPRVSPLLATDFAKRCPAIVVTAGFDPLRDEGHALARALEKASVPTKYRCFEGMVHGFINMASVCPAAEAAFLEVCAEVKHACETRTV